MREIKAPVTIITGDADKTVSTNIHSRPFAATAPNAKLIVLPGVGHMVQNAVPDLVIAEVEAMIGGDGAGCGSGGPLRRAGAGSVDVRFARSRTMVTPHVA